MIKILCGAGMFVISTLFGIKLYRRECERMEIFESLLLFCEQFRQDLYFKHTVIQKMNDLTFPLSELFDGAALAFSTGASFECNEKLLTASERKIVTDFVNKMGLFDDEGGMEFFSVFIKQFTALSERQRKKCEKAQKTYVRLGAFVGAILFIVMV